MIEYKELKKFTVDKIGKYNTCDIDIDIIELPSEILLNFRKALHEYRHIVEQTNRIELMVRKDIGEETKYIFKYDGIKLNKVINLDVDKCCEEAMWLARKNQKLIQEFRTKDIENLYEQSCKYVDEYCKDKEYHILTPLEKYFLETNKLLAQILIIERNK